MKIRLKALGLQKTTGYLIQPLDQTHSGTAYGLPSNLISEMYYREITGVIGGERLGTENDIWVPYKAFQTQVAINRNDKVIIDLITSKFQINVTNIIWQSGNLIRYTFTNGQDLHNIVLNTWYSFSTSINIINNGIFKVKNIGTNYIDVINPNRSNNTKDETSSISILTQILTEYELSDIKRELQSMLEDHYQITIYQKID